MSATEDALLTAADLAEKLGGVTEEWVKRQTKAEDWPHVRLSPKVIRYTIAHYEAIVAKYDQAGRVTGPVGLAGQTAASKARAS